MKPALLDTNVLLALAWPNHQHHAAAHRWFGAEAKHGWATCALTQLAFVRLSSNPAFTRCAVSPTAAAELLAQYCLERGHRFWDSPPAADPGLYRAAVGHQQVTDAWLVEVARQHGGRLVTFDARLAPHGRGHDTVTVLQ